MVNTREISACMARKGYNIKETANLLDISPNTLSLKLNGKSEFTLAEANKLVEILDIVDPAPIFFAHGVPNMQRKSEADVQ